MSGRSFRSVPTLVDVALAGSVVLVAGQFWLSVALGGVVYGCLAGGALLWRRRRPVAVFVVVCAVTAAALLLPVTPLRTTWHVAGFAAAAGAALYAVVRYAASVRAGVLAAAVAVLGGAAVAVQQGMRPFAMPMTAEGVGRALEATLFAAVGVWSVAFVGRLYLSAVAERAQAAERERDQSTRIAVAEERARIARELHDIVAHSLSVMVVHANGAEYALGRDDVARAAVALRTISATGCEALEDMKRLVQVLRSDDAAAAAEPAPVALAQLGAVAERARGAGLTVDLAVEGSPPVVPGGIALAVHRIVQEALTNTLKHAGPAPAATVRVTYRPDGIEVEVEDTGSAPVGAGTGGHGLVGMRERAGLYGGEFEAGPRAGGGWRVRARIPLAGGADRGVPA